MPEDKRVGSTSLTGRNSSPQLSPAEAAKPARSDADAMHRRDMKLGYLIHDISRLRRTAFDQVVKPLGVTRAQWWVIAHLARHDGMVQTQLAEVLDVGKASLGALLDRLEMTGFIERRPELSDRRAKRVFLTKPSLRLLEQLVASETAFNAKILEGLSDTDRRELMRLLSIIRETLSSMEQGASAEGN
jgi:DNA-binding MarR family transcriptional regulator